MYLELSVLFKLEVTLDCDKLGVYIHDLQTRVKLGGKVVYFILKYYVGNTFMNERPEQSDQSMQWSSEIVFGLDYVDTGIINLD